MSTMTIIPDLYIEGDSQTWKNWQAIISILKLVRIAAKSMVKYTISAQNAISPCMSIADALLCQCEQKRWELQTDRGFDGADAWLLYRHRLPDDYVTKEEAATADGYPKNTI